MPLLEVNEGPRLDWTMKQRIGPHEEPAVKVDAEQQRRIESERILRQLKLPRRGELKPKGGALRFLQWERVG